MSNALTALFAFLGAAAGSVLPFLASRASTKQEGAQGRREEWGRRFTAGLEALTSADPQQRAAGRGLLRALLQSDLATADDRQAAEAVLEATATYDQAQHSSLRLVVPPDEVDQTRVVEDTEDDEEEGQ